MKKKILHALAVIAAQKNRNLVYAKIPKQRLIKLFALLLFIFAMNSAGFAQKRILFDNTKAEQAGNADWVLDVGNERYPAPAQSGITGNPLPTPTGTTETYWSGALSSWGVDMAKRGYIVENLKTGVAISYGNAANPQDLSNYNVFVLCEPNSVFTAAEKTAMLSFVQNGGGLFMIADHGGTDGTEADRNGDGWNSSEVLNDFMYAGCTNAGPAPNASASPFGFAFAHENYSNAPTTNLPTLAGDPLLHGVAGDVTGLEFHGSTTIVIDKTVNPSLIPVVYRTGVSKTGTTGIVVVYGTYGSGRFVGMGDSSIPEDITPNSGITYDGWIQPIGGAHDGHNGRLVANATIWLCGPTGPSLTVAPTSLTGFTYIFGSGPSASQSFTISGSYLEGSTITITPPTNYQICLTSGGTYVSTPLTITYTAPTLAPTTIYVKLKAGLAVGTYNGENIACSDNGTSPATTVNVSCSGSVTASGGSCSGGLTENFQTWTAKAAYTASFTQVVGSGTWTMTDCGVFPAGAASGTGSIGYVQMKTVTGIIELPNLATGGVGTVTVKMRASSTTGGAMKLQKNVNGAGWVDVTTWSVLVSTAATYTFDVNDASTNIKLRLVDSGTRANYVHDIDVTCYAAPSCSAPTVDFQSTTVSGITTTAATFNGTVTSLGGGTNVTTEGFEYSTNSALTGSTTKSQSGTYSTGNYSLTTSVALAAETQYYYRAYAINNCATPQTGYSATADYPSFYTLSLEPTNHATSFTATAASSSQINLSFSAASTLGNADGYIIIKKTASNPTGTPTDAVGYLVGDVIGDGDVAAIITNNATTSTSITGLTSSTQYYFILVPYNYNGTIAETYNYKTSATIPSANATTLAGTPTLALSETTLSGYTYVFGSGPSAAQTFSLSGTSLDGSSVAITAPTNYVVSTDDITYGATATVNYTAPTLAATTIYIKLKSGLVVANYNGEIVTCNDNGTAVDVTVTNNGTVTAATTTCGNETFANIPTASSSSYSDRTWDGDAAGVDTWTCTTARTDQVFVSGDKAICFKGTLTSPTTANGIGDLTITTKFPFSDGTYNMPVKVNGVSVGTVPVSTSTTTTTITGINVAGNVVVTFESDGTKRPLVDNISWTCYSASGPEINIQGNGNDIADGDATPTTTDHTDFGSTDVTSGTVVRTFTIQNTGTSNLSLTGASPYVAISGANAADFSVTANPSTPIAASGSTTFQITFNPSASGVRTATLTIANDDSNEGTYDFAIQGTGTVPANSSASDIIRNAAFTEPTNIAYASYQSTNIINDANSIEVAKFDIRDGAATTDGDAVGTTLTDISFTVSNWANIRRLAIYDGVTEISEVAVSSGTVTFSSLTGLTAADGSSKTFTLRASFNATVTDNQQFSFTVNSATADAAGSTFAAANAGAAVSSTTGDANKIEVTATKLVFIQQPANTTVNVAMATSPTVKAYDANNNTDIDYSTSVSFTSSGTLSGTPVSGSWASNVNTAGALTHTATGTGLTLTASSGTLTNATSSTFDITAASTACATDLIISEYYEGASNDKYIEIYNGTNASINLTGYKISIYANGSATASDIALTGTIAVGATHIIAHSSSNATILGLANQTSVNLTFNGDDAVALRTTGNTIIDVIGVIGTDPGTEWGTGLVSTVDNTLVRKSNITSGDSNGSDAFDATVWDGYANTTTYAGSHTMTCGTPDIAIATTNPAVAAANIKQGSLKQPIYKFTTAVTNASASLNSVAFTTTNAAATDITKYQLWYKSSDDFSTATQIGTDITTSLGTGTHTFSGLTQSISSGSTGYFWITVDVASSAVVGNTLSVSAAMAVGDLTFASGNKTNSGTSTGGLQTIIAGDPVITVSPTSLSGFTYQLGAGPSTSQSFNISGIYLTGAPGNLTITGSANYEVSSDNTTFGTTASIPYASATLTATPVYVRLKAGAVVGTYNENISYAGGGVASTNFACSGTVTAPTPEMDVQGNATSIADGDATPSATDWTIFGSTEVNGGTIDKVFTIYNTGMGTLNLTGTPIVVVGGTNAADFTVTSQPSASSIAAGGNLTFTVRFNPSAVNARNATLSIANDDASENPYNFSIQGTGIEPEIVVQGNGNNIVDGDATPSTSDWTDFGSVKASAGTIDRTFTINNTGAGILNLSGTPIVVVGGANAADFMLTVDPVTPVAATSGSTTFTVRFNPSATGIRTATLSIANDDASENPFNFTIQGYGLSEEPSNYPTVFACGTTTSSSIPLTWIASATGTQAPDGYLILWSTDCSTISNPTDYNDYATNAAYIAGGSSTSYTVNGLSPNTAYCFKIYPYTNDITGGRDYKTDGTVPQTDCLTQNGPCAEAGFETGTTPAGWTTNGAITYLNNVATAHTGSWAAYVNSITEDIITPATTNPASFKFWGRTNGTPSWTAVIQYSTSVTGPWTTAQTYTQADFTATYQEKNITVNLSGVYYFRIAMTIFSTGGLLVDDATVWCTVAVPDVTITTPAIAAGNVEQNTDNHILYNANLTVATASATLTSVSFTTGGNYQSTDLKSTPFKLWVNSSNDFSTATQLGVSTASTSTGTGETVTFSGLGKAITMGNTACMWLTADVKCDAVIGRTISVNATNNANYTVPTANFVTTGPYNAGGTQSVIAGTTVSDVTALAATNNENAKTSVSWTNPVACFNDVIIIIKQGSSVTATPTGNGTLYTANSVYSTGGSGANLPANEYCVYKGGTSPLQITGLTNGLTYYIKVFVRNGTYWSSGVEVTAKPNIFTVLYPADLAIIAVNTNIGSADDEVCFITFKDISEITAIDFTDNGFERVYENTWGETEGVLRLQRKSGGAIPAGTPICFRGSDSPAAFHVLKCGVNDDSNWDVLDVSNYGTVPPFNLNANDQIWIMQNADWNEGNSLIDHDATYTGNLLYGWTATGWKTTLGIDGGWTTDGSRLPPNAECFNTNVSVAVDHDRVKYTGPMTDASQSEWISRINDNMNWTGFPDLASYNAIRDYSNSCITFVVTDTISQNTGSGGLWTGEKGVDWFNCNNWADKRVPSQTTNVVIPATSMNSVEIDDGNGIITEANCNNLTLQDPVRSLSLTHALSILNIYGHFTNNAVFNHSFGKVLFKGTNAQSLSGTAVTSFNDLTINNTSSTGVTLNRDITINGLLTLTDGNIYSFASNGLITMNNTSSISGSGANSYINGPMKKIGNTAFEFPLGKTRWAPIAISAPTDINDAFTANYFNAMHSDTTNHDATIDHISRIDYWDITRNVGASNPTVTLFWKDNRYNIVDMSQLVVAHYEGGIWKDMGMTGSTGTNSLGSIQNSVPFTSFSPITLATKIAANPLPIELFYFDGKRVQSEVILKWATASEINNNYFAIERSADNVNFYEIGNVNGVGNSKILNKYQFVDTNPLNSITYYRLKQYDFDGKDQNSNTVVIESLKNKSYYVDNYSSVDGNMSFILHNNSKSKVEIFIYDMIGKEITRKTIENGEGVYHVNISNISMRTGVYNLILYNQSEIIRYKVFVK